MRRANWPAIGAAAFALSAMLVIWLDASKFPEAVVTALVAIALAILSFRE